VVDALVAAGRLPAGLTVCTLADAAAVLAPLVQAEP
jgi:hypothetical protein